MAEQQRVSKQDANKFIFSNATELAKAATAVGMEVKDYLNLYFTNLNTAQNEYLYTAYRYPVIAKAIRKEHVPVGNNKTQLKVFLDFEKTGGEMDSMSILGFAYPGSLAYRLAENVAKNYIGKRVWITKVYQDETYKAIADIYPVVE